MARLIWSVIVGTIFLGSCGSARTPTELLNRSPDIRGVIQSSQTTSHGPIIHSLFVIGQTVLVFFEGLRGTSFPLTATAKEIVVIP